MSNTLALKNLFIEISCKIHNLCFVCDITFFNTTHYCWKQHRRNNISHDVILSPLHLSRKWHLAIIMYSSGPQSSTQNAHYRYPASTACSFSQNAWCAFGEEKVSFAWKVKRRTFAVDIITTGIIVDFPVSKMRQNWQANAYFDVFLFRWMKRTISSMKTNYYRINRCDETNVIAIRVNHLQKETILNQHMNIYQ